MTEKSQGAVPRRAVAKAASEGANTVAVKPGRSNWAFTPACAAACRKVLACSFCSTWVIVEAQLHCPHVSWQYPAPHTMLWFYLVAGSACFPLLGLAVHGVCADIAGLLSDTELSEV